MLSSILRDSFAIWTRSFTLIYVFFLFLLVVSIVVGNPAQSLTMDIRSLVLTGLVLLIFSAMMSGFYNMVAVICRQSLAPDLATRWNPDRTQKNFSGGFKAFKNFLPGIGQFFVPMTIGYLIQGGFLTLLFWLLNPLWLKATPILNQLLQALANNVPTEAFIHSLSMPQLMALNNLVLGICGILLGYGFFSMVTMLWPVMMVNYTQNPLLAYGRSLRQFFRDPLRLIALSLLFFTLKLLCSLLSLAPGLFLNIFSQMSLFLLEIFITITLFVYAWRNIGQPVEPLANETPASSPNADRPS